MKAFFKLLLTALGALVVVWLVLFLWQKIPRKPAQDEAMLAGKTPADFPQAAANYFHDMDGRIALSDDEVKGRNTWMVWTAGNQAFWDYLANHSYGTFDLLKTLSSYPCSPQQEVKAQAFERSFVGSQPDPAFAKRRGRMGYGEKQGSYGSAGSAAGGDAYGGQYGDDYGAYRSVCADTMYPKDGEPYYRNYNRDNRFCFVGLINEPGFRKASKPDEWGLCLDERTTSKDPFDEAIYGRPSGVLGLRLFPNPNFDGKAQARWKEAMDDDAFYLDPDFFSSTDLVRPYRVGMSCAFCHVSHHPTNPPEDPERPAMENLSATIGAQYMWFGRVFGPNVDPDNLLYHILDAQQPGAADTSFLPTDHLLNPRAMNAIYNVPQRIGPLAERFHQETSSGGALDLPEVQEKGPTFGVPMVLWDGADSVGVDAALTRVYINIGEYHQQWIRHVHLLVGLRKQTPIEVKVAQENSTYWNATQERAANLAKYLAKAGDISHNPMYLKDTPGGNAYLAGGRSGGAYSASLERGKIVFAESCARCHSSKIPKPAPGLDQGLACGGENYLGCFQRYWNWTESEDFKAKMRDIVMQDDFLEENYLSTDARIPITLLKTEACSAMASNAIAGHVWDNFSSETYKDLPSVGNVSVIAPVKMDDPLTPRSWSAPGGGRGYQRVPSLINIWATAPYLHNNEVGWFTNDPSVEGRMVAFDHGIRELLWPERRGVTVHRTDRVTDLSVQTSSLPDGLNKLVEGSLFHKLLRGLGLGHLAGEGTINIGPIPAGTPVSLIINLNLDRTDPRVEPKALVSLLLDIKQRLQRIGKGENPDAVWTERSFLDRLLDASSCPDFVVDRGHTFGADLADEDKEALIEFIKTF